MYSYFHTVVFFFDSPCIWWEHVWILNIHFEACFHHYLYSVWLNLELATVLLQACVLVLLYFLHNNIGEMELLAGRMEIRSFNTWLRVLKPFRRLSSVSDLSSVWHISSGLKSLSSFKLGASLIETSASASFLSDRVHPGSHIYAMQRVCM